MNYDEYIRTIDNYAKEQKYDSLRKILEDVVIILPQIRLTGGMTTLDSIVLNRFGIHARPASVIVKECNHYPEERKIYFVKYDSPEKFKGRGIFDLMSMEGSQGTKLKIEVSGEDIEAKKIVLRLHGLIIAKDYDEMSADFFEKQMNLRKINW
jgi:phosphotransferase system HPr (HPr) family protein